MMKEEKENLNLGSKERMGEKREGKEKGRESIEIKEEERKRREEKKKRSRTLQSHHHEYDDCDIQKMCL